MLYIFNTGVTFFKRITFGAIAVFLLMLCKSNTIKGQGINFSLEATANLGLVYEEESHFETERTIPNALRLGLGRNRRRVLVSAKAVSTLNYAFSSIPSDVYTIQLNNASSPVNNSYSRPFKLSFSEQTILAHRGTNYGTSNFNYDLIIEPIGYDYEPGQYFYSIIFTISDE